MKHRVIVQDASESGVIPAKPSFRQWARAALPADGPAREVTIRVVDETEGRELNQRYRGRDKATNVLSFAAEWPAGIPADEPESAPLGDLVLCAPVIRREAAEQGKAENDHWAHLVVHGVLHLLGMDHQDEAHAAVMEGREIAILSTLGISDPYRLAGQ